MNNNTITKSENPLFFQMGILDEFYIRKVNNLIYIRLLSEINNHNSTITAQGLVRALNFNKSLVSRTLKAFENEHIIIKEQDKKDKRNYNISLTKTGKKFLNDILS